MKIIYGTPFRLRYLRAKQNPLHDWKLIIQVTPSTIKQNFTKLLVNSSLK